MITRIITKIKPALLYINKFAYYIPEEILLELPYFKIMYSGNFKEKLDENVNPESMRNFHVNIDIFCPSGVDKFVELLCSQEINNYINVDIIIQILRLCDFFGISYTIDNDIHLDILHSLKRFIPFERCNIYLDVPYFGKRIIKLTKPKKDFEKDSNEYEELLKHFYLYSLSDKELEIINTKLFDEEECIPYNKTNWLIICDTNHEIETSSPLTKPSPPIENSSPLIENFRDAVEHFLNNMNEFITTRDGFNKNDERYIKIYRKLLIDPKSNCLYALIHAELKHKSNLILKPRKIKEYFKDVLDLPQFHVCVNYYDKSQILDTNKEIIEYKLRN